MLREIIEKSVSCSLEEFEGIIVDVIVRQSEDIYSTDMHPYVAKNSALEKDMQSAVSLQKKFFNAIQKTQVASLNLITEAWCLDASIILPLLKGIAIANPSMDIRLYLRDRNEDLMQLFLTNGSKSIPIVFGLDTFGQEVFRWGPRSARAKEVLAPIINEPYGIKYQALSNFYKRDLTQSIQEEWIDLL
jgi:hypothetical protein